MAQPLLAQGRIVLPYLYSGFQHVSHFYVRNPQNVGATYNINSRALDENDLDWKDAAQSLWLAFSYMLDDAVSAPIMKLETFDGVAWNLVDTVAATGGNGSGTGQFGNTWVAVFRDVAFKKMKIVVAESPSPVPGHYTSISGAPSLFINGLTEWTEDGITAHPPFEWNVSRGDRYLKTSPFVSVTGNLNRKIRRARGLA